MKRSIAAILAIVTASVAISAAVACAVKRRSREDPSGTSEPLLSKVPVTTEQETSSDGSSEAFGMISTSQEPTTSESTVQTSFPVTEEYVRYIGRDLYKDNAVWLVQSGSAVEFTVNARSAEITLRGDRSIDDDISLRPRYAVIVDGETVKDSVMSDSQVKIELFSGDEARTAEVKIIHLSEAEDGAVGVAAIEVDSDAKVPIAPAAEKELRIEFIGDSITCGYGVDAASLNEHFSTATENFMKSYAYFTAELLGAEYSAVSYSGHGIISGYSPDGSKVAGMIVPRYYENYGSMMEYSVPWDFSAKPNDVVVINLGTNDSTYINSDPGTRGAEFTEEYTKFLMTVRRCNPDAYIICTLGIMGGTAEFPMIEKAIADYTEATGDERIDHIWSPIQSSSDGYGADWHPSEATQRKNAELLAAKISQVLAAGA